MKSPRNTAARTVLGLAALGSLVALSACGAGQITQTSDQVAPINGVSGEIENAQIHLRDVTVTLQKDSSAAVKFTVVNENNRDEVATLKSVSVADTQGQNKKEVSLSPVGSDSASAARNCSIVADSATELKQYADSDSRHAQEKNCISYVETSLDADNLHPGSNVLVNIDFGSLGSAELTTTVAAYQLDAGSVDRAKDGGLVNSTPTSVSKEAPAQEH